MTVRFLEVIPTPDSSWRAIVLFGRNVASYKFALAQALLAVAEGGASFVALDDLAVPYARALAAHLANADKQATSASSRFLDACRAFNRGELAEDRLREATVRLGFANVIDAFHVVNQGDVPTRFFADERAARRPGLALTDDLLRLAATSAATSLPLEAEARWRLVETAWSLALSPRLLAVRHDPEAGTLFIRREHDIRVAVTSARDALNGYQKGRCFYCGRAIAIAPDDDALADVDHFFPLAQLYDAGDRITDHPLNGVWNLVLACRECNRGVGGKFARVPEGRYLERLHRRNEFLIASHHPLRETLSGQTGATAAARASFLRERDRAAIGRLLHRWHPMVGVAPPF